MSVTKIRAHCNKCNQPTLTYVAFPPDAKENVTKIACALCKADLLARPLSSVPKDEKITRANAESLRRLTKRYPHIYTWGCGNCEFSGVLLLDAEHEDFDNPACPHCGDIGACKMTYAGERSKKKSLKMVQLAYSFECQSCEEVCEGTTSVSAYDYAHEDSITIDVECAHCGWEQCIETEDMKVVNSTHDATPTAAVEENTNDAERGGSILHEPVAKPPEGEQQREAGSEDTRKGAGCIPGSDWNNLCPSTLLDFRTWDGLCPYGCRVIHHPGRRKDEDVNPNRATCVVECGCGCTQVVDPAATYVECGSCNTVLSMKRDPQGQAKEPSLYELWKPLVDTMFKIGCDFFEKRWTREHSSDASGDQS